MQRYLLLSMIPMLAKRPRDPITPPSRDWINTHFQWPTHSQPLMSSKWALIILGGLIGLLVGLKLAMWLTRKDRPKAPLTLFHQVAKQVGLDWKAQWLLIRIAKQQKLPNPLPLMVCPTTLVSHSQAYVSNLPDHRKNEVLLKIAAIQYTLFGK